MLLKRLEIRNVRKVKQADIEFHGAGAQEIVGRNGSGKTTIAQSISLTLNGPKAFTPGMITEGAESAEIIAYTDDGLKIRTIIGETVKQDVYRAEGDRYTKVTGGVREFLNSIRSGLETPWEMKDMTDEKIINLLKDRYGISAKITEIEARIKQKEQTRTEVGRDNKRLGELIPVEKVEHAPPIDSLKEKKAQIDKTLAAFDATFRELTDDVRKECDFKCIADMENFVFMVNQKITDTCAKLEKEPVFSAEDAKLVEDSIAAFYENERKADAYDLYEKKLKEKQGYETQYQNLTAEIEGLRDERKKVLAGMKLGIKGLEISEDNQLIHNGALRGITETNKVSNWSTAESVRVFFSIGSVFASDMKILVVDNAESLDEETQKTMSDWAEKAGFLVILLKVGKVPEDLEEGIIYVKEGEVITK